MDNIIYIYIVRHRDRLRVGGLPREGENTSVHNYIYILQCVEVFVTL